MADSNNTKRVMTDAAFSAYDVAKLQQDTRLLYSLFDTLKAAFYAFVTAAKTAAITAITTTKNAAIASCDAHGITTKTEAEYQALSPTAGTMYYIFPSDSSVEFNANGGTGTMATEYFDSGVARNLVTNNFTYTGYTFSKWNTAADGSGTDYDDGASVTFSTATSLTLYAQWTANS